jgi:hypothetical protein
MEYICNLGTHIVQCRVILMPHGRRNNEGRITGFEQGYGSEHPAQTAVSILQSMRLQYDGCLVITYPHLERVNPDEHQMEPGRDRE